MIVAAVTAEIVVDSVVATQATLRSAAKAEVASGMRLELTVQFVLTVQTVQSVQDAQSVPRSQFVTSVALLRQSLSLKIVRQRRSVNFARSVQ